MHRNFFFGLMASLIAGSFLSLTPPAVADDDIDDNSDFQNKLQDLIRQERLRRMQNSGDFSNGRFADSNFGSSEDFRQLWRQRQNRFSQLGDQALSDKQSRKFMKRQGKGKGFKGGGRCNRFSGDGFSGSNAGWLSSNQNGRFGNGRFNGALPPGLQWNLSRIQNGSFPGQGNGLRDLLGL